MISPIEATQKAQLLAEKPDQMLLARLRVLEKKMGLVLTLVTRPPHRTYSTPNSS